MRYLLAITVIILPVVFVKKALDPTLTPRTLLMLVSTLAMLSWTLFNSNLRGRLFKVINPKNGIIASLLIYLMVTGLSLLVAINPIEGLPEIIRIVIFLMILVAATTLFLSNPGSVNLISKSVVIACLLIVVFGLLDVVKISDALTTDKILYLVSSTAAHKNLLASSLYLGIPFSLIVLLRASLLWKFIAGITILSSFVLILIVQTRAVWLAIALSFLVAIILPVYAFKISFQQSKKRIAVLGVLGIAMLVSLYISNLGYTQQLKQRVVSMFQYNAVKNEHTETIVERLRLWGNTWEIIKDHPITGVGAGNWKIVFPSKGMAGLRSEQGVVNFQRPHNDFLWVWSETGIIGLMAYLAVFIFALTYSLHKVKYQPDKNSEVIGIITFSGILGYCVISFFDFPRERMLHLTFLALLIAIPYASYLSTKEDNSINPRVSYALLVLLFAVNLFGIIVNSFRLKGEVLTRKGMEAADVAIKKVSLDRAASPFYKMDLTSMPLAWYQGQFDFMQGNYREALKEYQKALQLNPYQIHVLNNLATCYHTMGDRELAMIYYHQALKPSPHFYDANLNLSIIYLNEGEHEKALHHLLQCPPDKKHSRYLAVQEQVMNWLIDSLITQIDEREMIAVLQRIKGDPVWLTKIHGDVIKYNQPFRSRLLKDVIYSLEVQDQKITRQKAIQLSHKYSIEYDLNH